MRDKTHLDHIEKWASFVRTNPDWQKTHTEFINAQFEMAEQFMKRLLNEKEGEKKLIKLYGIKNIAGYKDFLNS